jgi:protein translocase SecG subunit
MTLLTIAQIIISILLIILITLQEQSSETSGIFGGGGGSGGGFYQTRRGLEKILFGATVAGTGLFIILALANLVVPTLQNLF